MRFGREGSRARYDWLTDQSIGRRQAMAENGNGKFGGREVVIVEAVRTPIGRGHEEKGYYKDVHASNLLSRTFAELVDRAGIEASEVEDVVSGCVQQFGEQMFNVGRNAWLQAGLPIETPATTVDRQCGSAQQAVNFGAALVAAGVHDAVIGSGVEHMGHIPMGVGFKWVDEVGSPWPEELMAKYNLVPQGISAEMIADKWEIPRSELDEIGLLPHTLPPPGGGGGRPRRPRRAASSARAFRSRSTATPTWPTRAFARTRRSRSCRRSRRRSRTPASTWAARRTCGSPPATRRRSRTARPPFCSRPARRPTPSGPGRGAGSRTRRPSAAPR